MITNDRQYKITKRELAKFKDASAGYSELDALKSGIDPVIANAQKQSLFEQIGELETELAAYEALKAGVKSLQVADFEQVGIALIRARVAIGLSQKALAERLSMKEQQIQRYEQEAYLSASLKRIQAVVEALQIDVGITLELGSAKISDSQNSNRWVIDARRLPINMMKKRGWFDQLPSRSLDRKITDVEAALEYVTPFAHQGRIASLHKQNIRALSKQNEYALLAWKARVLSLASKKINSNPLSLDAESIAELVRLSIREGCIRSAVELLESRGVALVFVEHLPETHLDGAALLSENGMPVIGMTLRENRFDNFWFTLLHEVAHVTLHREKGLKFGFFDEEEIASADGVEREANDFASRALISEEVWRRSFVRFTSSEQQVIEFSAAQGVSAAIVAGRIRRERQDYTLFSKLVGQGEVRKEASKAGLMEK